MKPRAGFLERNKIEKSLARITKNKRERIQLTKIANERGEMQ